MKTSPLLTGLALALFLAGPVTAKPRMVTDPDAPRSVPAEGAVSVDWTDPAQFSEIRHSMNRWEAKRGNWVEQLARHLQTSAAKRLPPGERLQVTLTDITRAGDYEPWHGPNAQDTRIVRDIYPPRISLTFKRTDAQGNVIAEGERKLSDSGFMYNGSAIGSNDTLRYEKRLLDDWIRKEFRSPELTAR